MKGVELSRSLEVLTVLMFLASGVSSPTNSWGSVIVSVLVLPSVFVIKYDEFMGERPFWYERNPMLSRLGADPVSLASSTLRHLRVSHVSYNNKETAGQGNHSGDELGDMRGRQRCSPTPVRGRLGPHPSHSSASVR